ncbi:MAG TPA: XrtA system polysaccharide chain length determinant [Burkholderiaceae bacterium]|nr:XrtA system polysaccharide chain length determinant [Burkholderiaceae bacterium]
MMNSFVPQHVADALRGMWQGRWAGLVVAWLAAIAGGIFVHLVPDRYEATARVYVDTQSLLKPLLQGLTVQPNVEQEVMMLSRTLISRPNLEKLVRMTDLDLEIKTSEQRENLLDGLSRTVYIKSIGQNLYSIGFTHRDRAQATRVVQSLLSIFVESGLAPKAKDTGQAQRFIEEQIKTYEQKLSEAENRLKEFKLKNIDLNVPQGRDFFGTMATLTESLQEARLLLQEAEKSRDALKQQITDEEERPPVLVGAPENASLVVTPEIDARIAALTKNLDDMLLRYTDGHPDVLNTRRIIKEAEAQRDQERKRLVEEQERRRRAAGAAGANPVYPQLKLAMAESEAQVARLRARVNEQEQRLERLRLAARSVPEREAQLTQLNRDYAIQKQNYDALVARRESALMSGEVQAATGVASFRIVDPPQVSPNPVAPNRKVLVLLALLASLGAGLAASYFFSLLHPTFHDARGLKKFTHRPVLGTVSVVATPEVLSRRRRGALAFVGGLGGLGAAYAGLLALVFFRALLPF